MLDKTRLKKRKRKKPVYHLLFNHFKTTTFKIFMQVYQKGQQVFLYSSKSLTDSWKNNLTFPAQMNAIILWQLFLFNVSKRQQDAVKTSGCCQVIKKHRIMHEDWLPKSYYENRTIKEFLWEPMNQDSRQKELPHRMIFRANHNKPVFKEGCGVIDGKLKKWLLQENVNSCFLFLIDFYISNTSHNY